MAVPNRGTRRAWTPCWTTTLFFVYVFLAAIDVVWLVKVVQAENESTTSSTDASTTAEGHVGANETDTNNATTHLEGIGLQLDSEVRLPSLLWGNSANVSDVGGLNLLPAILGSRIAIVDSALDAGKVSELNASYTPNGDDAIDNRNVTFIDSVQPPKNISAFFRDANGTANGTSEDVEKSDVQGAASAQVELPTLFYEDVHAKHAFLQINSLNTTPRKNGEAGENKNNNNNNNSDDDGKRGLEERHEKNNGALLEAVATSRGGEARGVTAERNGRGETGKEGDTLAQESRSTQLSNDSDFSRRVEKTDENKNNESLSEVEGGGVERNTRDADVGWERPVEPLAITQPLALSTAPDSLPLGDNVENKDSSRRDSVDVAGAWTGREEAVEKVFELTNRDLKSESNSATTASQLPVQESIKMSKVDGKSTVLKKQGSLAKWSSTEQKLDQASLNQNGTSNIEPPPVGLGGAEGWPPTPDLSSHSADEFHQPDLYWARNGRPAAGRVGDNNEGLPLKMEVNERGSRPEAKESMSLALVTNANNETQSEIENGHGTTDGHSHASNDSGTSLQSERNTHDVSRRDTVNVDLSSSTPSLVPDSIALASEKRSIDVSDKSDQLTDRGDFSNPKMKTPVQVSLLHQGSLGVLPNKGHGNEAESTTTMQDRHSTQFRDSRRHEHLHFNGHTEGDRMDGFVVRIPDGSNFAIQKRRQHQLEHNRRVPNHFSGAMLGFNQGPRPFDQRDPFVLFDLDVPPIVAQMPEKFIPNFNHQRPHQINIVHRPHPPVVEVQHFPPLPNMNHFAPPTPPRSRPNPFRENNTPMSNFREINTPNSHFRPTNTPNSHFRPTNTPNSHFRPTNTPNSHFRPTNRPSSTPRPMQSHIVPTFHRPFNASHEGRVVNRPVFVDHGSVSSPEIHIRIPTSVGETQVDGPWTFFEEKPMNNHGPLEEMEISPPFFQSPARPSASSTPPPHRESFRPSFHSTESTSNQDFRDDFRHQGQEPMHHQSTERPIFHDQVFLQQDNSNQNNFDHTTKEHSIRIHIENGEPSTIRKPPPSFHNSFSTNRPDHSSTSGPNQHSNQNNHFENHGSQHSSMSTPHHSNSNNHFGDSGHHQSTTPRPLQHHLNMNNHHTPTSQRPPLRHESSSRPTLPHRRPSIEIITRLPIVTAHQNPTRRPINNHPVPIEIDIFSERPSTTQRPTNNGFRTNENSHHNQKPTFRPHQFDNHPSNFNHDTTNTNNRPWQQNSNNFHEHFSSATESTRPTTNRFPDHTRPFQSFKPTQKRPNIEIPDRFQTSTRPTKFRPGTDVAPHWENTQITQHFQDATRPSQPRPNHRPNIEILHNEQDNTRPHFQNEPTENPHWSSTPHFRPSPETFRPTKPPSTNPSFHSQQSNRPPFHSSDEGSNRPNVHQHGFTEDNQNNEGFNSNNFNSQNDNHNNFHSSNNFNSDFTSTLPPNGFSRPNFDHRPSFNHNQEEDEGFTVEPDPAVIPPRPPFLPTKPDPMYVDLDEDNRNQEHIQPTLHITPRPPFTTPASTTPRETFRHSVNDQQFTTPSPTMARPQQERPATNFRDFKTSKGSNRNTFAITTSRPTKTSFNNFENHFVKTTKHDERKPSPTSSLFDVTTQSTPVLRRRPTTTMTPHDFPTFPDDQQRVPIPKFLTPLVKFRGNAATENSLVPNSAVQITPKAIATPEFTVTRFPNSFSTVSSKFTPSTSKPNKNHRGKFKDEDDYDTLFTPFNSKPQVVRITTPIPHSSSPSTSSRRPSSLPSDFSSPNNHQPIDDDFDDYEDFHDEQDDYDHVPTTPSIGGDKGVDFGSNSVSSTPFPSNQGNTATDGHPSLFNFPPSLSSSSPHKPTLTFSTKEPSGGFKNPTRPASNTNRPIADSVALPCDADACQLPNCFCGGNNRIPGDLSANEVPQLVMLTFDDDVNEVNWALYKKLLYAGRQNPNGCPISTTFYVSHEWTDYSKVQTLYADGHEIASHSISHPDGARFSKRRWEEEIFGQKQILSHMGNVAMNDIRGMRAPFLAVGGNKMFGMLHETNFTYDSSLPVPIHDPPYWPYTLDYALGHDCMIPPCPRNSYPSLWELPMVMWVDLKGGRCSMADACMWGDSKEKVTANLMKNFQRHYTSNRAPFNLFFHSAWFDKPQNMEGFQLFLDKVLALPDVYFVTASQVVEWMRQPTPLREIHSFVPFSCHLRSQNVGACKKPHECQLRFKGGETRYVRTCQECPSVYPWINNPYGLSTAKKTS